MLDIFEPLFDVTKDPSLDPKLHLFLKRVVGFDCVDDESKQERRFHKKFPFPKFWESKSNPPYSYYTYYLYSNLAYLNQFRKDRGFSTQNYYKNSANLCLKISSLSGPIVGRLVIQNISCTVFLPLLASTMEFF